MAKKKKSKKKLGWRGQILLIASLFLAGVFLPSTVLLLIGMLPTPFAILTDRTKGKTKVMTVGSMNLAGCSPFLFQLWTVEHSFSKSIEIATDPLAIIVMWSSAAVGYVLNWAMTGIVSATMHQRGLSRQKSIQKRQNELIERWGQEVTGDVPLDQFGFLAGSLEIEKKSKSDPDN
jgi:hypothetical protein